MSNFPNVKVNNDSLSPIPVTNAGNILTVESKSTTRLADTFSEKGELILDTGYLKTAQATEATSFAGFYFDTSPNLWISRDVVNGAITHYPTARSFRINIGSGATDRITRQSARVFPYYAGNVFNLDCGVTWDLQTGANLEIGYGDDNNHLIFLLQKVAGVMTASLRCKSDATGSPVTNTVAQANWNIDKMDGTGPSGKVLDLTKGQMLSITWTWYGFGGATWGIKIDGRIRPVHMISAGNYMHQPLLGEPNQPIRYRLYNSQATAGNSYVQISGIDLKSIGVDPEKRLAFSRSMPFPGPTKVINSNTNYVLASVRPKTTWKGRDNRGNFKVSRFWLSGTGNGIYALIYNPTLTGASWVDADSNNSFSEYDISATGYTGGTVLYTGGMSASTGDSIIMPNSTDPISPLSDFSGTNHISLVFRPVGNGSIQFGINWDEFI